MSTLDRINAIVAEATDAIAHATDTAALEEARIRYLGRKAELPNLLRTVAELPPGGALGHRQGRERGPQSARAGDRATGAGAGGGRAAAAPRGRPDRHHAPRRPAARGRAPARDDRDAARDGGHVHRARVQRRRGPRGRDRLLQLRRAQHRAHASLAPADRHLLHRAGDRHLRPELAAAPGSHLAGPGPGDGAPAAADLHRHARARVPAGLGRHPHAPVPPARGARDRYRRHACGPQGDAARVRARVLRRRARGPPAPALLPVHRAERRGRRVLLQLHRRRHRRRQRCSLCKGSGWIEILGAGMVDPNVLAHVAEYGYDPERSRASRSGWGSSGSRCSSTESPTCG